MKGLVSVIVPVYNVKDYLVECLESIISSNYKNIEVILIDDGSSDGSAEICDIYKLKDNRIKVLHQQNSGVSIARNVGMSMSKGDFLFFCDADDYVDENMIGNLYHSICANDSDVAVCGYRVVRDGELIDHCLMKEVVSADTAIEKCLTREYDLTLWNKLFKKSSIDSQNMFREDLKIGEDALWLIKTLLRCGSVSVCDTIGYNYRQNRAGSAVYNSKESKLIESCISRYRSNYEIHTLLLDSNIRASQRALKTAVFSVRDLLKEAYLTDQQEIVCQYKELYSNLLVEYIANKYNVQLLFTLKSIFLLIGIKLNVSKRIIRML